MSSSKREAASRICLSENLPGYTVTLAYLYGSVATGKATPLSDVDVALVGNKNRFDPSDYSILCTEKGLFL